MATHLHTVRQMTAARASVDRLARRKPVAAVWFGAACFSTGPIFIAEASIRGAAFAFWRLWLGTALLGVLVAVSHRRAGVHLDRQGVRWAVGAGVAFALHQYMLTVALEEASVVTVTLMGTLSPVIVAVLAIPLFGERPSLRFRAWSVVSLAGAAVIAFGGSGGGDSSGRGALLAVGQVVFYAIYFVGSKQARGHMETTPFLFVATATATVIVSGLVAVAGAPVGEATGRDLLLCAAVALLPGFVGHFAITWSLRWVPANVPPVILLSGPVMSGFLAYVVLDQVLTWQELAGGLVTLVGVAGALTLGDPVEDEYEGLASPEAT